MGAPSNAQIQRRAEEERLAEQAAAQDQSGPQQMVVALPTCETMVLTNADVEVDVLPDVPGRPELSGRKQQTFTCPNGRAYAIGLPVAAQRYIALKLLGLDPASDRAIHGPSAKGFTAEELEAAGISPSVKVFSPAELAAMGKNGHG